MGHLFSLLSAASWGISNIYVLKALDDKSIDKFTGIFITLFVNNIVNLIILISYFLFYPHIAINTTGLIFFSIGGFLNSFAGRSIFFLAVSHIGASRAGVFKMLSPVFAILGGVVILHETMSSWSWLGMAIVLLGVLLMSMETIEKSGQLKVKQEETLIVNNTVITISKIGIVFGLLAGFFLGSGNVFRKMGIMYIPSSILGVTFGSFAALIAVVIFQAINGRLNILIDGIKRMNKSYIAAGLYTSMALYTLFIAMKYMPISSVNSITASEPLFTMLGSLILLGKKEVLTVHTFVGSAVVVSGIILILML